MNELQGELSPQALRNMQNIAARFGVSSGMPGSNAIPGTLANNANLLGNIETTQAEQAQGLRDYESLLGSIGSQQLNPGLISSINQSNAELAAAPDPAAAAQAQLNNYYNALNAAKGPAAGTPAIPTPASGTGSFAPNPFAPAAAPVTSPSGGTYNANFSGPQFGGPTADQTPYFGTDLSNSNFLDWAGLDSLYSGDTGFYDTPANTVTTDTSSYYDPFAEFGGSDFGLGG